jgi:hypothetical protein
MTVMTVVAVVIVMHDVMKNTANEWQRSIATDDDRQ